MIDHRDFRSLESIAGLLSDVVDVATETLALYADQTDGERSAGWTGGAHKALDILQRHHAAGWDDALKTWIGQLNCAHEKGADADHRELTRLAERMLRLEALLLDPEELAKAPAEKLEQLRQVPGGAPLQLGRLAQLEQAVAERATLGDALTRIATALERPAEATPGDHQLGRIANSLEQLAKLEASGGKADRLIAVLDVIGTAALRLSPAPPPDEPTPDIRPDDGRPLADRLAEAAKTATADRPVFLVAEPGAEAIASLRRMGLDALADEEQRRLAWIPVEERLPFDGQPVLAAPADRMPGDTAEIYIRGGGTWFWQGAQTAKPPTHWQPLPPPPGPDAPTPPQNRPSGPPQPAGPTLGPSEPPAPPGGAEGPPKHITVTAEQLRALRQLGPGDEVVPELVPVARVVMGRAGHATKAGAYGWTAQAGWERQGEPESLRAIGLRGDDA